MEDPQFLYKHILASLLAGVSEAAGSEDAARRLRAQARLRLITMSEADRWELARLLADRGKRPVERVFQDLQDAIADHCEDADEWLQDLRGVFRVDEKEGEGPYYTFEDAEKLRRLLQPPDS